MEFYIFMLTWAMVLSSNTLKLRIGSEKPSEILPRFWTSTGFCPIGTNMTEYFSLKDLKTNLELIGAIPNAGLKFIRIHWLLDLLEVDTQEMYVLTFFF